ncbi:hypothetical protein [Vibrio sp. WXL103]|uniref:hypothetical protein n=1 Tax=Vibrio sp. WXL103 TaxID=3450710 RepID=UPI003EC7EF1F
MKAKLALLMCCGFCASTNASVDLRGEVVGRQLSWTNGQTVSVGVTPSHWDVVPALTPTSRWRPGALTKGAEPITLEHRDGVSKVDITPVGIEYRFASFTPAADGPQTGTLCSLSGVGSSTATVGTMAFGQCYSDTWLLSSSAVTPFSHVRPLFNTTSLATDLYGKPAGVYRWSGSLSYAYEYAFSGSGQVVRRVVNMATTIEVHHRPDVLMSISKTGNGVIEPVYDYLSDTVSGEAVFDVRMQGQFDNGITLAHKDASRNFSLTDDSAGGSSSIAYSVLCDQCKDTLLVREGRAARDNTVVERTGTELPVTLRVRVENAPIEQGQYRDSFTLVIRAGL